MMKIGNTAVDKIYIGATKVEKVYLGAELVYSAAPAIPIDGLVAYYKNIFDNIDSFGTSTLTNNGVTSTVDKNNIINSSGYFNRAEVDYSYGTIGQSINAYTICCEFKLDTLVSGNYALVTANNVNSKIRGVLFTTGNQINLYVGSPTSQNFIAHQWPTKDTNWHKMVARFDGINSCVCIDGVILSTDNLWRATGIAPISSNEVAIGASRSNLLSTASFSGKIAKVLLYNKALTDISFYQNV